MAAVTRHSIYLSVKQHLPKGKQSDPAQVLKLVLVFIRSRDLNNIWSMKLDSVNKEICTDANKESSKGIYRKKKKSL